MKRLLTGFVLAVLSLGASAQFAPNTVLTATALNNALASPTITGGSINGAPIGNVVSSSGAFTALSASGVTTLNNNENLSGTLTVTPTPSSLSKAFSTTQSISGASSVNCTTTSLFVFPCANLFYISSEGVDASSPNNVFNEWQYVANFGGSTLKGGRQLFNVIGTFTGASNAGNTNPSYVAFVSEMATNSSDGGTAPTIANGRGSFFGSNPITVADSGAQNLFGLTAEEVNALCFNCSTAIRWGLSSVGGGNTQAAVNDAALHVGAIQSGSSWHQALNLSNDNGVAPLDTAGCVICTDATANTIATGIDLSTYTISGNFLKGPNGFMVSGAGLVTTANGLTVSGGGESVTGGLIVNGGVSVNSGTTSVGALAATGIVSGAGFTNLFASPPSIGNTAANTGAFTTLSASSTVSGAGFTSLFASPPAIGTTTPAAGKFTTLQATSTITPSSTAGIVGTTTNDNANAGSDGEYSTNTTNTTSLTNNTSANCTSVSLTAGDWDVSGTISFNAAATTTISALDLGISTTSATLGGLGTANKYIETFSTGPASDVLSTPVVRESLSAMTTVYLVGLASFGTSTMTCDGFIRARRVR